MSRPLRIEYENAFYHVMNRGRGRENTFLSDDDFKYFLNCIEQASLRFNIEVHSYCLMTNHYHILMLELFVVLTYRGDYSGSTRKFLPKPLAQGNIQALKVLFSDRSKWSSMP